MTLNTSSCAYSRQANSRPRTLSRRRLRQHEADIANDPLPITVKDCARLFISTRTPGIPLLTSAGNTPADHFIIFLPLNYLFKTKQLLTFFSRTVPLPVSFIYLTNKIPRKISHLFFDRHNLLFFRSDPTHSFPIHYLHTINKIEKK